MQDGRPKGRDAGFAKAWFRQPFPAGARTNPSLRDQLCQALNQLTLSIATSSPDLCIVLVTPGSDP